MTPLPSTSQEHMEYRSKRLQNTRYSGGGGDAPTPVHNSSVSKPKQIDAEELKQPPPLQQKAKSILQLWYCLYALYAWVSSLFFSVHTTCHQQHLQQHEDRVITNTPNNWEQQQFCRPPPEYSSSDDSDSIFECSGNSQELYGTLHHQGHQQPIDECTTEDHEFPFVGLIDNICYFWKLYRTNNSAFKEEFSSTVRNLGFLSTRFKGVTYGHNINPSKSRPRFVQKGIQLMKNSSFLKATAEMTRITTVDAHKRWVLAMALASRILIFIIQFVTINLPDYFRHKNDGFQFIPEPTFGKRLDGLVTSTFGGYLNWDANYFLHISVYGYSSENMLAFFPLLPVVLYVPSRIVSIILSPVISLSSVVLVMGVLLNTWLFVKCAGNIYELAKMWANGSQQFITTACVMFCFNPASIFFSGLYTETLFAYLTSKVILSLFQGNYWSSIWCAALSGLCRSNGLLNVGFIIAFILQRELSQRNKPINLVAFISQCFIIGSLSIIPFIVFQGYGVRQFCQEDKEYNANDVPLYCSFTPATRPSMWTLPYSYVQKKYWNVGFLNYFQFKQLPNFMLAAPVLFVLSCESWSTFKLSFREIKSHMAPVGLYECLQAAHGLFLTFFCFFFVHVQVSTRMIMSACPYLYLYLATSYEDDVERFRNHELALPKKSLVVTLWCVIYYLIGTIGFSLGLPWT